jgi:hypothetical protein
MQDVELPEGEEELPVMRADAGVGSSPVCWALSLVLL